MLSPSKICTNCAPIIFEYYQKGLATQTELMRMRDELQRANFTKELGTLKNLSDAENSVSPKGKYQLNSRMSVKRPFTLNLTQKESSRLDKQASLATTATIVRSSTPAGKFSEKVMRDYHGQQKRLKDPLTSVNTITQSALESVSPLERIRNFEDQVNRKVDSFKKKLREEAARSAKRPSYNKVIASRPKTSAKALRFSEEDENKSDPRVSMFSPDEAKKNMRASPVEFKLTPRHEGKENLEKGSGPSRGEWTVGTNNEPRGTTNTDRGLIYTYEKNQKRELNSSIKKIKTNFTKELDLMKVNTSPGPQDRNKLNSPFFSPLKASDLMSPNGHHHIHGKSEELKHNYTNFIKPNSNPLLDSLMLSPRDYCPTKDTPNNYNHVPLWVDRSSGKNPAFKNNNYEELFKNPLHDNSPKNFVKKDKNLLEDSNMKDNILQDGLHTSLGAPKFHHSQSFNKFGNKLYQK